MGLPIFAILNISALTPGGNNQLCPLIPNVLSLTYAKRKIVKTALLHASLSLSHGSYVPAKVK